MEFFSTSTGQAAIVIAVFALTIVAFVVDKVRSDIVALCSLALLLITNVLTPAEALAGFSNSAVVMMIGLFVVYEELLRTSSRRANICTKFGLAKYFVRTFTKLLLYLPPKALRWLLIVVHW